MNNNKKEGNSFEAELCDILSKNGFFAHNFKQGIGGQPVDVLACNSKIQTIMDCKLCSNGYFDTNRMEDNQILSMTKWLDIVKTLPYWVIKFKDTGNIYMVDYCVLDTYHKNRWYENEIATLSLTLDEWLENFRV